MRSWFVRQAPHRPWRRALAGPTRAYCGLRPASAAASPSRYVVGLRDSAREDPGDGTDGDGQVQRPYPPRRAGVKSAPMAVAFYLGRVVEGSNAAVTYATLWERPGGQELAASFQWETRWSERPPVEGDLLRVWTWLELPGGGQIDERLWIEVRSRQEKGET